MFRFPTLDSHVQVTPTNFKLRLDAAGAGHLQEMLQPAEKAHVHCKIRICPLPSNNCNWLSGYRSQPSHETLFQRILLLKEKQREELKEVLLGLSGDYIKDEIVHVNTTVE